MSRTSNILRILRRRRASLGRFVLGLFAFASVSLQAAPCFAMATSAQREHHVASHAAATANEHVHEQLHAAHAPSAIHGAHGHAEPAAQPDPLTRPCPHCPLSTAMFGETGSHSACSAGDDASDAKPTVTVPSFKHAQVVASFDPPLLDPEPSPAWTRQCRVYAEAASVALNLRHCVFLI